MAEIYIYNDTRSPHRIYSDSVVLTSGVYEVYYGGRPVAKLRLMTPTSNTTIINLSTVNATAPTERVTVTQTDTVTTTAVVEKPYLRSITYAVIAAAVAAAVLAVYIAKRSRATKRKPVF